MSLPCRSSFCLALLWALGGISARAELSPSANFFGKLPGRENGLRIKRTVSPHDPWTVAGERAGLLGRQDGRFEAWSWPNKIFSNFAIHAQLADYAVPIDVNALAAQIDVFPAETVITYSHADFTIRQHMFAARGPGTDGLPAAVVFEIASARKLDVTFSFTPEMLRMWPAPSFGRPSGEWVNGVYLLHTDNEKYTGLVAMPRAQPGTMVPYQEHPQTYPLELKIQYDPQRDQGVVFPLIYGLSEGKNPAEQAQTALQQVESLYQATQRYYQDFMARHLQLSSPDPQMDEALAWAELAIDQTQVRYHDEIGLVAGYYESADSARPGYAWFFGRDTLWTTYGINAFGDAALTRRALEFLIRRQRDDGKIMHEYSQSADSIDWKATPYFYAAADSAPLLVMAMWDYVRTTGDQAFLQQHWDAVKRAWMFQRSHTSPDGFYNNSQGTGWVESWPQGMPHQEVYLAALDCESAFSMARLAELQHEADLQKGAAEKGAELARKLPQEYLDRSDRFYAFSRNDDGTLDHTASMYSSVAWWDNSVHLPEAEAMFRRWASDEFSTDWGVRDISNKTAFYDPISYHQGSIWPLFTGWVSTAEFRAGHPLSGYTHLMENVNLTWEQDLGSVTELLSGDFYSPLGRSSSHQMWSSAMVIAPMLHGLFGLDWDVPRKTLVVQPHLPARWQEATLQRVPFGEGTLTLTFKREGGRMTVRATSDRPTTLCLVPTAGSSCQPEAATVHSLSVALPPVELQPATDPPDQGARTSHLKILGEQYQAQSAQFELSAPGGSRWSLPVRLNRARVTVEGAELKGDVMAVEMPSGEGYQTKMITFSWGR